MHKKLPLVTRHHHYQLSCVFGVLLGLHTLHAAAEAILLACSMSGELLMRYLTRPPQKKKSRPCAPARTARATIVARTYTLCLGARACSMFRDSSRTRAPACFACPTRTAKQNDKIAFSRAELHRSSATATTWRCGCGSPRRVHGRRSNIPERTRNFDRPTPRRATAPRNTLMRGIKPMHRERRRFFQRTFASLISGVYQAITIGHGIL